MSPSRVLVVTPTHNEVAHARHVVAGMLRQTRPPDAWVLIDDGSTDGTLDLLRELCRNILFASVVCAPPSPHATARDRLAAGAPPRTFNAGLRAYGADDWSHVAKIDGDIELPPNYLEEVLKRFAEDQSLGIAGGEVVERRADGRWKRVGIPRHHVPGAVKLYSRDCFGRIGGIREQLAWDTIDEMYARMHGYRTRSYDEVSARHHRPTGRADGILRGRARHGACAWIAGYPTYFVLARAVKLTAVPPVGLSGAAFLYGYARAAARVVPRVEDRAFRTHVRTELRGRVHDRLGLLGQRRSPA